MIDKILLYISAAGDLELEREILGRAITEVPVTLGWRIVYSPIADAPVDLAAVAQADVHLLLLASDIRAPIGLEWTAARRAGRWPVLFLKQRVLRTLAAQSFVRYIGRQADWRPFSDGPDLRAKVLSLLADHIMGRAGLYSLSATELAHLRAWRTELDAATPPAPTETLGGAGESGVVFSPERYIPSNGVLMEPVGRGDPEEKDHTE